MAAPTEAPASTANRRQRALEGYLDRVRSVCTAPESAEEFARSGIIAARKRTLTVDPWVREQLCMSFRADTVDPAPFAALLQHGVALMTKSMVDMERLEQADRAPGKELYALQGELMLDTAIGMALLREMQHTVDGAVGAGNVKLAKSLTRFHHELRRTVTAAKESIASSERERAEALSDNLTDRPREAAPVLRDGGLDRLAHEIAADHERSRLAGIAAKRARQALAKLPSRTDLLIIALVSCSAFWFGFIRLPAGLDDSLPLVDRDDFVHTDSMLRFDARPPSLFVTVDAGSWDELSSGARRERVEDVSTVLLSKGYSGAWFGTEAGRPVARWLRLDGVQLLDESVGDDPVMTESPAPLIPFLN